MFTRKDYLDGKCSHDEYYAQLVEGTNAMQVVLNHFPIDVLEKMYKKDEHFNWVPREYIIDRHIKGTLSDELDTWDRLGMWLCGVDYRKYGDLESLCGRVCVLKCAARMLVKKHMK